MYGALRTFGYSGRQRILRTKDFGVKAAGGDAPALESHREIAKERRGPAQIEVCVFRHAELTKEANVQVPDAS